MLIITIDHHQNGLKHDNARQPLPSATSRNIQRRARKHRRAVKRDEGSSSPLLMITVSISLVSSLSPSLSLPPGTWVDFPPEACRSQNLSPALLERRCCPLLHVFQVSPTLRPSLAPAPWSFPGGGEPISLISAPARQDRTGREPTSFFQTSPHPQPAPSNRGGLFLLSLDRLASWK